MFDTPQKDRLDSGAPRPRQMGEPFNFSHYVIITAGVVALILVVAYFSQ